MTQGPHAPALSSTAAMALAAAAGFAGWAVFSLGGPRREAWDSGTWWLVVLPLLALVAGVLGYLAPRRVWRWAAAIVGGQVLAMVALRPAGTDLGLFPLTAAFLLIPLGLILSLPALVGGAIARRQTRAGSLAFLRSTGEMDERRLCATRHWR